MTDWRSDVLPARFTQTIAGVPVATACEDVVNPATGAAFQTSPVASDSEIAQGVAAARRAQPGDAILVIGATGRTGRVLVADLLERGLAVRALVRDVDTARGLLGPAVELIQGDLREPAGLTGALAASGRIVLVAGSNGIEGRGTPREIECDAVAAIVAALRPEAVSRFVLLSSAGVTQPEHPHNCTFHSVLKWKLAGEDALRGSGLPYTIVRALGLRDRAAGAQGVRIVQGDRMAFGEDIARGDLAALLADVVAPEQAARFAAGFDAASLDRATCEVYNDSRIAGQVWASKRVRLEPDAACAGAVPA